MNNLQHFIEQIIPLFAKQDSKTMISANPDIYFEKLDNHYFISCINDLNNPRPSNHEIALELFTHNLSKIFIDYNFTINWENRVLGRAYMPTMEMALNIINIFDAVNFNDVEKKVIFQKLFNNIDFVNIYSLHEIPSEKFTKLMLDNWKIKQDINVVKLFENINNHHYNDICIACLKFLYNNKDIINAYDSNIKIELYKHLKKNVSSKYYQDMEEFLHIDVNPLPLVQPTEGQLKLYTINHRNSFFNKNFKMIEDLCNIFNKQDIEGFQYINVFKNTDTSTTLAIEYSSEKAVDNIMLVWNDILPIYDELIMKQPEMKKMKNI